MTKQSKTYRCNKCGKLWPDEELARICCMYKCGACVTAYETEEEAYLCCSNEDAISNQGG